MDERQASDSQLRDYYAARAPEFDNWYLRRGRYSHGPLADAAWTADLAAAAAWLDALPLGGEIVELAAGTGWWSERLAGKGNLWAYDATEEPLRICRERLGEHGLTAHVELRDAWAEPDRRVDTLFCGFWLSHVPRARFAEFLSLCRQWLKPGGTLAFIDSRRDPESSARNHPTPADDLSVRRLDDGREFTIVKVFYEPAELEEALVQAGFDPVHVIATPRFFVLGVARADDIGISVPGEA